MTHVFDVVKFGLTSTSKSCIYQAASSGNGLGCADDNSPNTQEPCAGKLARTVLRGLGASDGPSPPDRTILWILYAGEIHDHSVKSVNSLSLR